MGLGIQSVLLGMPLDADDGKNDHRCRLVGAAGATEPGDAPWVREFDNRAHGAVAPLSCLRHGSAPIRRFDFAAIKWHARLTLR